MRATDSRKQPGSGEIGKAEAGVSPVVGVMLMLSVTVIIAAIVSATAGGLSGTSTKAPGAILDVKISNQSYGDYSVPTLTIEHISGNILATKDLQIVTYYRTPSGIVVQGNLSGAHEVSINAVSYPVLYIRDDDHPDLKGASFGNASANFKPGDILVTPAQYCALAKTSSNPSMTDYFFPGIADFATDFSPGSVVTVKIIHTPSGRIIFDKDVVIE